MSGHTMEVHHGESVTIRLATGEELHPCFTERLSIEGYGVQIMGSKLLAILPSAGNAAVITTPRAMAELEARCAEVVAQRIAKATGSDQ